MTPADAPPFLFFGDIAETLWFGFRKGTTPSKLFSKRKDPANGTNSQKDLSEQNVGSLTSYLQLPTPVRKSTRKRGRG